MNWDALYVAACLMLLVILILLTVIETPADREDKEAFWQLRDLYTRECIWRLNNDIKPVFL